MNNETMFQHNKVFIIGQTCVNKFMKNRDGFHLSITENTTA